VEAVTQGLRALQIDCHFEPVLGATFEDGLHLEVRGPFCQLSAPQRALTAFDWIGGHGGYLLPITRASKNKFGHL
jgi:hypothetical protein